MGRQRGQGNQGGDKKKDGGGEKAKIRRSSRYTDATRKVNKRMHLLSEADRAARKLVKLLLRGDILPGSEREKRLDAHITRLQRQARTI